MSDTDQKALERAKEEALFLWREFEYQFSMLEKEYSVKLDFVEFMEERMK